MPSNYFSELPFVSLDFFHNLRPSPWFFFLRDYRGNNLDASLIQVQQTSLVFPGAYRKVSVEIKVINVFSLIVGLFGFSLFLMNMHRADP